MLANLKPDEILDGCLCTLNCVDWTGIQFPQNGVQPMYLADNFRPGELTTAQLYERIDIC